ncbi:KTSC domain-containing protein [Planococcus koreensis]|uniref:KTSC domain-containing protein n=1 Tax=Planococcus koreensis TaxID=112331 RepID=UPI0039FBF31B
MNMQYVSSSNLVAIGYDPQSSTLRIQFRTSTYDYFGVPESVYRGLMSASSHGGYHAAHIKNSYGYDKV